jgi:hypothetical protein
MWQVPPALGLGASSLRWQIHSSVTLYFLVPMLIANGLLLTPHMLLRYHTYHAASVDTDARYPLSADGGVQTLCAQHNDETNYARASEEAEVAPLCTRSSYLSLGIAVL